MILSPTLTVTSLPSDLTPDFTIIGDLQVSDVLRLQWDSDIAFPGPTAAFKTLSSGDISGGVNLTTGTFTAGTTRYFRVRIERPSPADTSDWSNTVSIAFSGTPPVQTLMPQICM